MYEMCVFFQILSGLIQFCIFSVRCCSAGLFSVILKSINVCILLNNNISTCIPSGIFFSPMLFLKFLIFYFPFHHALNQCIF